MQDKTSPKSGDATNDHLTTSYHKEEAPVPYSHTFLDPKSSEFGPNGFFDAVSHKIDLSQIYKVKDVCYFNQADQQLAALVEIKDKKVREFYDGYKYLLQFWNFSTQPSTKVGQIPLNKPVKKWALCGSSLIYTLKEAEEGKDLLYISTMDTKSINTLKISGIGQGDDVTGLLFQSNRIFIVKTDVVERYDLDYSQSCDYETVHDGNELPRFVADIQLKIHDIFLYEGQPVLILEGLDNVLDFNYIYMGDEANYRTGQENCTYQLQQAAVKAKRQEPLPSADPVVKYVHRINLTKKEDPNSAKESFGMALRKSGGIDFYIDMTLTDSVEGRKQIEILNQCIENVIDINANQEEFYIKMRGFYNEEITKDVKEYYSSVFGTIPIHPDHHDVNSYISFVFIMSKSGYFMKTLARTDAPDIVKNFREQQNFIAQSTMNLFTSVDLRGGSCLTANFAHSNILSFFDLQTEEWIHHIQLEADIVRLLEIKIEDYSTNGIITLIAWTANHKLFKITQPDQITDDEKPSVSIMFDAETVSKEIIEVVVCNDTKSPIYLALRDTESCFIQLSKISPYEGVDCDTFHFYETSSGYDAREVSMKVVNNGDMDYILLQTLENYGQVSSLMIYQCALNWYGESKEILEVDNLQIKQLIHSAICINPQQQFMLFDFKDAHIINVSAKSSETIHNVNIKSMITDKSMDVYYVLKQDKARSREGLFQLDVASSFKNSKPSALPLAEINMGANFEIQLGLDKSRIGFFQSYNSYIISILPSRNLNKLYNDIGQDNYSLYNQIGDKIVVLSNKDKKLYSYDAVTAKLSHVNQSNIDLTEYKQFSFRGYSTLIYVKLEPEADAALDMNEFYPPHMNEVTTLNQISFRQNRCPKDLHRFKVVQVKSDSYIETLIDFLYPYSKEMDLYLHVNSDVDHLIARDELGVFFYKLVKQGKGPEVKLELIRQITEFSNEIQVHYQYRLDMFSPKFTRFLSYDPYNKNSGRFLLHNSFTGEVITYLSDHQLRYNSSSVKGEVEGTSPQSAINRMVWVDENHIRVIQTSGIEVIVSLEDEAIEEAFHVIPFFKELYEPEFLELYHLILSRRKETDPVIKLQKLYQEYTSAQKLFPNETTTQSLNRLMMKQDFENFDCVSHSFTLLSWQTAHNLRDKYSELSVDNMSEQTLLALIYSIFPGGDTVFHYLVENADQLYKLLNFCHPDGNSIKYPIPFLKNALGKTPLHLCIDQGATKAANTLLRHLSLYGIDHHSRQIADLMPQMIELKLGDLDIYLESRFQQNSSHKHIEKMSVADLIHYCTNTPILDDSYTLSNKILGDREGQSRKVLIQALDIANIYHYDDPLEDKFFDSLANTDEFSYFELKSIQALIDFNYPLVQKFLIRKLFLPYIAFHCSYLVLIFILFERRYEDIWIYFYWAGLTANCIFAAYFLLNELRQISNDGWNYFKSFWNYIDMIPIFGIYIIGVFSIIDGIVQIAAPEDRVSGTIQRIVVSIVTLFMWLKFLYFFRIFDKTSYMIRAVVECVKAMRYFFFILLFTIFAFGNAFLILSLGNDGEASPESVFIGNYVDSMTFSYRMLLGDFDTGAFGETAVPLVWILFLIFTVFNIIVMLNLLVAVISDAYAEVAEVAEQAMYQERASMIAENNYLIPESDRKSYAAKDQFILMVTDLEQEQVASGNDAVIQKVDILKATLVDKIKKSQKLADEERGQLKEQISQIRTFILQTLPKEEIYSKIYKKKLTRMTLLQMQEIHPGSYEAYGCDGRKFEGCLTADDGTRRNEDNEVVYHCQTCMFDVCEKCFEQYGNFHYHGLEKLTLGEIKVKHPDNYDNGYGCDCASFQGCKTKTQGGCDVSDIVYHNAEDYFDLCEDCADYYRIEE